MTLDTVSVCMSSLHLVIPGLPFTSQLRLLSTSYSFTNVTLSFPTVYRAQFKQKNSVTSHHNTMYCVYQYGYQSVNRFITGNMADHINCTLTARTKTTQTRDQTRCGRSIARNYSSHNKASWTAAIVAANHSHSTLSIQCRTQ